MSRELGAQEMAAGGELPSVVDALVASGVVASKSAARRAIAEGGAYVNNAKASDPDELVLAPEDLLQGRYVITRRGKKTVGAVEVLR